MLKAVIFLFMPILNYLNHFRGYRSKIALKFSLYPPPKPFACQETSAQIGLF